MNALWLVAICALLSGCITQAEFVSKKMADAPVAQKSPAYKDGYSDGCYTGYKEGRSARLGAPIKGDEDKRDDARMGNDNEYRLGWTDGSRQCLSHFQGGGTYFFFPGRR